MRWSSTGPRHLYANAIGASSPACSGRAQPRNLRMQIRSAPVSSCLPQLLLLPSSPHPLPTRQEGSPLRPTLLSRPEREASRCSPHPLAGSRLANRSPVTLGRIRPCKRSQETNPAMFPDCATACPPCAPQQARCSNAPDRSLPGSPSFLRKF